MSDSMFEGNNAPQEQIAQERNLRKRDLRGESEPVPEVLSSRSIYEGKVVSLRVDEIALAQGGSAVREVVQHRGAVVMAALDADGNVYLVRQYRHAIGRWLLELPAGSLEPGEDPLVTAQRELREEVGLQAREWRQLGSFFSSPGFASEELHAFLAQELESVPQDPDEDEELVVVRYPLAELLEGMVELCDGKTLATLFLLAKECGKLSELGVTPG